MADEIIAADEFLAHFGVKGMKWGQKRNGTAVSAKKMTQLNKQADKGDALLARSGGRAGVAQTKLVGRRLAVATATTIAVKAVGKSNPKVRLGVALAAGAVNNGMFVKDVFDSVNIESARRRQATS